MTISIFELFKIGIGPSSSHTVGPMVAAGLFVKELQGIGALDSTMAVRVELFGSLALTGKGHGTDRAVLMGLEGENPRSIDPDSVEGRISAIRDKHEITLLGTHKIEFDEAEHLLFLRDQLLPKHSNGMRFFAFSPKKNLLLSRVYYSIGGGFVIGDEDEPGLIRAESEAPLSFSSAGQLLEIGEQHGLFIHEIVLKNEESLRSREGVHNGIMEIWQTMRDCVSHGLQTEGILPGGLGVRRRAARLLRSLSARSANDTLDAMDWVNVWAMAVNEENAAGGRVVTAPTNGAAGIIPAVLHYYDRFSPDASDEGIVKFFLTAGAIGMLYKENASISGAEVGCQGEVGVACSMAAGGLVAALGGTNDEVEQAAEIAMEHNLGMTCDPIGGLVQIPCIERNALGAVKAINAARLAMREDGAHRVSLDQVIETMYRTGLDMQSKYKETSLGGLAVNAVEC